MNKKPHSNSISLAQYRSSPRHAYLRSRCYEERNGISVKVDDNGLQALINFKEKTAVIIHSTVKCNVFIPQFVEYKNEKYKIISLGDNCFSNCEIDSLTFSENSEVESFNDDFLSSSRIKKLQIPPKLKYLGIKNLSEIEIEISPKNQNFIYYDDKFLLGKSQKDSDKFNSLYWVKDVGEELIIPPQVEIIKSFSLSFKKKLKIIKFPDNSKLKVIEGESFIQSSIKKMVLPASLEEIVDFCFKEVYDLVDIEISPKNKRFKVIDNKFLLKKSDPKVNIFDSLVFSCRDIASVKIPSYIKVIETNAFQHCKKLKSIEFEPNSSLEIIECYAFANIPGQEKIVFPPSIRKLNDNSFENYENIKYIQFLGQSIELGGFCFNYCKNLCVVSFPNADKINVSLIPLLEKQNGLKIFVQKDVKLTGISAEDIQKNIVYIEDVSEIVGIKQKQDTEKEIYMKRIRFLEERLKQYEKVIPFDPKKEQIIDYEIETETSQEKKLEDNIVITDEDEKNMVDSELIGEGSTSFVYKFYDKAKDEFICKKVLKIDEENPSYKNGQNIIKEFEILHEINHPCICKAIGMNLSEKVQTSNLKKEEEEKADKDIFEEDEIKIKKKKSNKEKGGEITTIAIFLKYHPMNLKQALEEDILNNTLKAKIIVEILFGMMHIHEKGMIHRDLKLENVMLNYVFESQIADFGLVYVDNLSNSMSGNIGTYIYMSPEMKNNQKYDHKTDVFSFGVLFCALFTRKFPKKSQSKSEKAPLLLPQPDGKNISKFSIDLIQKCLSYEPSNRPDFNEILEDIYKNSFKLAQGIDSEIVLRRYCALNRFKVINNKSKIMPAICPPQTPHAGRTAKNPIIIKPF